MKSSAAKAIICAALGNIIFYPLLHRGWHPFSARVGQLPLLLGAALILIGIRQVSKPK